MKGYIISIIIVGIIASLVGILSPDGEMQKQTRLAIGLVLIVVCISPLTSLINELRGFSLDSVLPDIWENEEYESIFNEEYAKAEAENSRNGIISILLYKFGIEEDEADVKLDIKDHGDGRRIECIYITLYGTAIWKDTGAIEDCLSQMFGCGVITAIG